MSPAWAVTSSWTVPVTILPMPLRLVTAPETVPVTVRAANVPIVVVTGTDRSPGTVNPPVMASAVRLPRAPNAGFCTNPPDNFHVPMAPAVTSTFVNAPVAIVATPPRTFHCDSGAAAPAMNLPMLPSRSRSPSTTFVPRVRAERLSSSPARSVTVLGAPDSFSVSVVAEVVPFRMIAPVVGL